MATAPLSDQKQAEMTPRPSRTREAHRRNNHASTQKTAEEAPRQGHL